MFSIKIKKFFFKRGLEFSDERNIYINKGNKNDIKNKTNMNLP